MINIIVGGFSEEFPTLRSVRDTIHTLIKGSPKEHPTCPEMKFDDKLSVTLQQSHTKPVVVTLKIGQMKVRCGLVDAGSTIDLINMDYNRQMKYEEKHLQPINKPLIGFGGGRVIPLGTIVLPVRVGKKNNCWSLAIRFTEVDIKFSFNTIIGLPLIKKIKAVISTHQLLLQCERDNAKVGILRADKKSARECLIYTLKNGEPF